MKSLFVSNTVIGAKGWGARTGGEVIHAHKRLKIIMGITHTHTHTPIWEQKNLQINT